MKHRTLDEIRPVAQVTPVEAPPTGALRRERLERLAELLDQHGGPIRLLSRIEYLPRQERLLVRADDSPLTVAFRDPVFRGQGLTSDRLGDGMAFFGLSHQEAHHLLCDCHYAGAIKPPMIAMRARAISRQVSFREVWNRVVGAVAFWRTGVARAS
jgi:hypothetical protein